MLHENSDEGVMLTANERHGILQDKPDEGNMPIKKLKRWKKWK